MKGASGATKRLNSEQASDVRRYLETGHHDELGAAWPGGTTVECARNARAARRAALCGEVHKRAGEAAAPDLAVPEDLPALVRARVEPMVQGLFPKREQEVVLRLLEQSVVVVTTANIERLLVEAHWEHTAWVLANLYLGSIGVPLLSPDAPNLVGISEETTCYLSLDYLRDNHPLTDYLVHEAAHVFHNCKRHTLGLPATRNHEWLLAIEFRKRETFAYACEAYGAICAQAARAGERTRLLRMLEARPTPADERVDPEEFLDIVREACAARNGWSRILARCAPVRTGRARRSVVQNAHTASTSPNGSQGSLANETAGEEKVDE
jgi:hypothetical protein